MVMSKIQTAVTQEEVDEQIRQINLVFLPGLRLWLLCSSLRLAMANGYIRMLLIYLILRTSASYVAP